MADTQRSRELQQKGIESDFRRRIINCGQPTHLDLFSGIGGFAIAAQWAGFRTIGFCEIDKYCRKVLAQNFLADASSARCSEARQHNGGSSPLPARSSERCRIIPNIFDLDGRDFAGVSLITGGFPCQPFSVAGKRRGAADDRAIWPQMFRVISEARPAWVLGENVPGIIPMELDNVLSDLEGIGYACRTFVIPACAVDARHRRDRVWIIGRRIDSNTAGAQFHETGKGNNRKGREKERSNHPCGRVSDSVRQGLEGQRQIAGGTGAQLNDIGDSCGRKSQSEFCGIPNGLSQELDSVIDRDMMGYVKTSTTGRKEELPPLPQGTKSEAVGKSARGSRKIQDQEILRSVMHGETFYSGACDVGSTQEKGREISGEEMRKVRDREEHRDSSFEQQSIRQHFEQSDDLMWIMSHQMALDSWKAQWPEESLYTPRVAHGIRSLVDRLKSIGNAIVPQVAYEILKEIRKYC